MILCKIIEQLLYEDMAIVETFVSGAPSKRLNDKDGNLKIVSVDQNIIFSTRKVWVYLPASLFWHSSLYNKLHFRGLTNTVAVVDFIATPVRNPIAGEKIIMKMKAGSQHKDIQLTSWVWF